MKKPVDILYVEDDAMDVDLAITALDEACEKGEYKMEVAEDGEKALQFLFKEGSYAASMKPDLILLDLNLPRVHGLEVLKKIKESENLRKIPVVILSTSSAQRDIDETYRLGACSYLKKPDELSEYQNTFRALRGYWFQKVNLPSK